MIHEVPPDSCKLTLPQVMAGSKPGAPSTKDYKANNDKIEKWKTDTTKRNQYLDALKERVSSLLSQAGQVELAFDYLNQPAVVGIYTTISKAMLAILLVAASRPLFR